MGSPRHVIISITHAARAINAIINAINKNEVHVCNVKKNNVLLNSYENEGRYLLRKHVNDILKLPSLIL